MKLRYLGLEQELVHEEYNVALVPRMGDMVWFDEAFYIEHIVWYPKEKMIQVYLSDTPPTKKKPLAEGKEPTVKLDQQQRVLSDITKRLDETEKRTRALSDQVGSVRKHINQRIREERKLNADT